MVLVFDRTQSTKLEIFQKKLLKQLLSLPQNAPDSAIYLLTGFLPVEAQIHKKALQLFNNITNRYFSTLES
jgi:hypothetical protein